MTAESNRVVTSAPMSFAGSSRRLANLLWHRRGTAIKATVSWWALPAAAVCAWMLVAGWYLLFGLLLVPYRLVRRKARRRKLDDARHQELLDRI